MSNPYRIDLPPDLVIELSVWEPGDQGQEEREDRCHILLAIDNQAGHVLGGLAEALSVLLGKL